MNLEETRSEYINESLNKEDMSPTPFDQLEKWMAQVIDLDLKYPNAISLSTVDSKNRPSSRIVLIKEILPEGVIFYTDYTGSKGIDLLTNRNVAATFYWKELDRQVRIQGIAAKIDPEKSEDYFLSRPFDSKVSALASNQSSPITREELERRFKELSEQYKDQDVPYPHNWGGYLISFETVEFWQGRPSRLHDRFKYSKENEQWNIERLAP